MSGIGQKIRDKIGEILKTGKLKKADEFVVGLCSYTHNPFKDEKQNVLNILTKVWGVGVQTATSLYSRGINSIAELRKNQFLLNDNQKVISFLFLNLITQQIGLKYFEEFEQRIPREEVASIVQIITMKVDELTGESGVYDVICCGSFRR